MRSRSRFEPERCSLARCFIVEVSLLVVLGLVSLGCTTPAEVADPGPIWDPVTESAAIRQLLDRQQVDWNDGRIESFMEGYWRSPDLRFASGGEVRRGWETTLERYRETYPDRATMGRLEFSDLEIDVVSPDTAIVFGGWRLERESDAPSGLYTLILRKIDQNGEKVWRIIADHTSSSDQAD